MYLTQIKESGKKLEIHGVAQSSTRVSTFMRNIDASMWMDNPQLQVVESAHELAHRRLELHAVRRQGRA